MVSVAAVSIDWTHRHVVFSWVKFPVKKAESNRSRTANEQYRNAKIEKDHTTSPLSVLGAYSKRRLYRAANSTTQAACHMDRKNS